MVTLVRGVETRNAILVGNARLKVLILFATLVPYVLSRLAGVLVLAAQDHKAL